MHSDFLINREKAPSATELTRLLPQDWLWAYYQREVKKHGWRGWQRARAHSARAMRLGTHTHAIVEAYLTNGTYICWLDEERQVLEPERRMKLVEKWAKALVETTQRHTIKEVEVKVIDTKRKEHGTIDAIAIDDETNLPFPKDWKTSGSIGIDYPIQLAIYNRAKESEGVEMAGFGEIERVDKELKSAKARETGEHHTQIKRFNDLAQYYPIVDALHVIWDYVNKAGKWKPKEKEAGV